MGGQGIGPVVVDLGSVKVNGDQTVLVVTQIRVSQVVVLTDESANDDQ